MNAATGRGGGRQWRRHSGCDATRRGTGGGRAGGGGRTPGPMATRTFLALAVSAAEDLRDRDGLARPLLRRGALRLTASRRAPVQRLGEGYLRIDPPTPEELAHAALPATPPGIDTASVGDRMAEPLIEDAEIVSIEEADDGSPDEAEAGSPGEAETGSPDEAETGSPGEAETGSPGETETGSPGETADDEPR